MKTHLLFEFCDKPNVIRSLAEVELNLIRGFAYRISQDDAHRLIRMMMQNGIIRPVCAW